MLTSTYLLRQRRFLPLFATQLLNAFNDNLYKNAMVLFVVYSVYNSAEAEAQFSAIASGLFILPFFLLSALAGQMADMRDKAMIIRMVKTAEILIMAVGAAGLVMAWQGILTTSAAIPLMLVALFAMGIHSTFFGPIKYAILPQHLNHREVLAGTGLVEAGTYIAILAGTILAGFIEVEIAAIVVIVTAFIGFVTSRMVPAAPPMTEEDPREFETLANLKAMVTNFGGLRRTVMAPFTFLYWTVGSSVKLVKKTMRQREVFYAILAISFFWTIGAVLFIQFPPLAKNVLLASKEVASLFLVIFSIGVAIGSVAINALLKGEVSARYAPISVIAMGAMVAAFYFVCRIWASSVGAGPLMGIGEFILQPLAPLVLVTLLLIAIAGGMFVVPLYAFLTTKCEASEAARTVAANNIVNSGAMVAGSLLAGGLSAAGIPIVEQLLLSAFMCLGSAWLGSLLHRAEKTALAAA
ncbi:MFS family permease [Altererythrobacter atlanticus]|uniref:Lysophospholipid transporter LplT n=1 Tax=Croceibacterium atlanticum TaxID=1267766 RepID=A0A0F7KQJ9_9SPHN|nr:MFS transporter [Croceibacterium atlanticum]AKH41859.1 Lysophospholipid transporter LplT [Croceibacterium atlanticum]MBB5733578.1 MFS family permease [Croceibacterium atlanticum]